MSAVNLFPRNELLPWLVSAQSAPYLSRPPYARTEIFNNLVTYLVRLRRDGTLNDADFNELIKMISATFMEAEISDRVDGVLDRALKKALPDVPGWKFP
uniref:Uncharacterized protein n=1 Tax=Candidatus Kentrum sp. DK TaxID=2126562 RepID=A0A450SPI0_9GAMM|nr:MAG: hypothetical protein BECKDK2373C_GA0170839_105022 [Candidatus Kentron sp. DK]